MSTHLRWPANTFRCATDSATTPMAIYRIDVRTDDAKAFSLWIRDNVPATALVRSVGYGVQEGWHFKNVFSDRQVAEDFHRHWFPDAESHDIEAFGDTET